MAVLLIVLSNYSIYWHIIHAYDKNKDQPILFQLFSKKVEICQRSFPKKKKVFIVHFWLHQMFAVVLYCVVIIVFTRAGLSPRFEWNDIVSYHETFGYLFVSSRIVSHYYFGNGILPGYYRCVTKLCKWIQNEFTFVDEPVRIGGYVPSKVCRRRRFGCIWEDTTAEIGTRIWVRANGKTVNFYP